MYRWRRLLERQIAEMQTTLRTIQRKKSSCDYMLATDLDAMEMYIGDLRRWIGDLEAILNERQAV
jgi:hypothetical protein